MLVRQASEPESTFRTVVSTHRKDCCAKVASPESDVQPCVSKPALPCRVREAQLSPCRRSAENDCTNDYGTHKTTSTSPGTLGSVSGGPGGAASGPARVAMDGSDGFRPFARTRGGVLKNTGFLFSLIEAGVFRGLPPSRGHALGRPHPNPFSLSGLGFGALRPQSESGRCAPPLAPPPPLSGCGCARTSGMGWASLPPGVVHQAAGAGGHARRRCQQPC